MKNLLTAIVCCGILLSVKVAAEFEPLEYDRTYMDNLTSEDIWGAHHEGHADGLPDGSGSPNWVKHIDGEYFDKYIVSRWTGSWLAGDTTWVIAVGKNFPWNDNYAYSLGSRSVTVLCNHFY